MAKHTMLLNEYLEENELPSNFSQIEGFKDLFIGEYCDREIGFETTCLFKTKLQHTANLVIPDYVKRIEQLSIAISGVMQPVKTNYTTLNTGKRKSKSTELPIDSEDADPNVVNEQDPSVDNTEVRESGLTAQDELNRLTKLNEGVKIILRDLLKEFDTCFMQIY